MMTKCLTIAVVIMAWITAPTVAGEIASSLNPKDGDVLVRIIDVGSGHAAVVRMPGGFYMIYDAGHWNDGGAIAFAGVTSVVPEGEEIDLMVISHTDADHLAAVDEILGRYIVRKIIRSGYPRDTGAWQTADAAIRAAEEQGDSLVIDLSKLESPPGTTYRFGETFVTMVAGFAQPPEEWGKLSRSERRNAGSIVVRLMFKGRSILFTGDAVGRHTGDLNDSIIATEKFMVDNSAVIPIDSDVLIAPHHGADNASSTAFIEAVSPDWVIFPAGHKYAHPRAITAERYLDADVDIERMLRTDRGDDEGQSEWGHDRVTGKKDPVGDDDIDVVIRADGSVEAAYRIP